ncbi:hypothetical protein CC86DRAFT_386882 [Ophiobolus disseminans]|uniref:Uncharacterized protein n=1 Tax=Ophiobolus disseminans TaxID=1469910 RepID=A0A6A6ZID2_9PLEO|nr:hypothetical protein CC86DRAFT_386882 [Ophiobolus disseminans]
MASNGTNYEALADQLEPILKDLESAAAKIGNDATRRRLVEGGRRLSVALETNRETLRRIGYALTTTTISISNCPLPLVGVKSKLFATLTAEPRPLKIKDISEKTRIHLNLLSTRRITAHGALNLPDWLEEIEYKDPVGILPTAWSTTLNIADKHPYAWLAHDPWALELAQTHMLVQRKGRPLFFDALNFEERFAQNTDSETIVNWRSNSRI